MRGHFSPDGETKHVLLSLIRWKGESIQSDTAYSVESIEVQEKAAEGNIESRPAAARQASVTRQGLAITDASIAASGDTETLARFLSGFKQEHRFQESGPSTYALAPKEADLVSAVASIEAGNDEAMIPDARPDLQELSGIADVHLVWGDGKKVNPMPSARLVLTPRLRKTALRLVVRNWERI